MKISSHTINSFLVVRIEGSIAAGETIEVQRYFNDVRMNDSNGIILNCEKIDYIDSSGLNFIVTTFKDLQKHSQRLVLCSVNSKVMEVFQLTRLNKILSFTDSEQSALKQYADN